MNDSISHGEVIVDPDYTLFAAVVAAGNLSGAARALGISPAMVSKRLVRLERRLDAQLVQRSTRRMALTESGARFHADVVAILEAIAAAEARVGGRSGDVAGPLRVVAPTSFGRLHVAPVLAAFLTRHPRVEVTMDLSDDYTDLIASRTDLAIRITATVGEGMVAERLADSRRILCAAPAYLAARGVPDRVADLSRHHLLAARGQLPWRLSGPGGRRLTVTGDSIVATNSSELVRELAMAGAGIALRSLWDVGPELGEGRLVRVLPDHEGLTDVGIYAVRPPGALVPASVTAFVAALRGAFGTAPPWELE